MKKTIIIALAALLALVGCTKQNPVSVSFEKATYVLLSDGTVDVKVVADRASSADLKIDLKFAGSAVKDQDYTVSAESVTIPAGQTSAAVTINAKENFEATNIQLSFVVPAGCVAGANTNATVAVDAKEKIVYSFSMEKATVLSSYKLKLELMGMESGSSFVATSDMEIPYKVSGAADYVTFNTGFISVAKGTNCGEVIVKPSKDMENMDPATVVVALDEAKAGSGFVAGENEAIQLDVTGILCLSQIEGTWNFDHIYDVDELALWFEEMEDDSSLLPLNNEDFSFTIAKAGDGSYDFIPSTTGDFANYFRTAKIDYCAPLNPTAGYEQIDDYCTEESNMFVAEEDEEIAYQYFTYFGLSNVNRAFSADSESLGKGAVSFYLVPDGLLVIIRDYDQPEFGEMWWDDDKFDPDMFGFAALFTRAE